jgi:hypothetical protein
MNGIDPSQLPDERQKTIVDILCSDSAAYWGHSTREDLHPSGEQMLDRLFYRALPTRTTSHSQSNVTKVLDTADNLIGEKSFDACIPTSLDGKMLVKDENPRFTEMTEKAKVLGSALKALEKQNNECQSLLARLDVLAKTKADLAKPALDLRECLKTLGTVMDDIREKLATAECVTASDDLGELPDQITELIRVSGNHLDGIKGMKRRLGDTTFGRSSGMTKS